jgi:SynChlorMet cassette radical SAM/SPASM protein ScmE
MWAEMENARKQGLKSISGRGRLTSCGGVFSKLAVRADGVIVPCNQLNHIELGRMNQADLKDIWQTHPELCRLRQRRSIPLSEFEYCQDCDYTNYCAGGCPAIAYTMTGNDFNTVPESCLKKYLEIGGRLPSFAN